MARQCRSFLSPLRQRSVMEWGYYVPIHLLELKLMSSPSLSDPPVKSDKAALDERGTQQRKAGANATWNSIHNAVIAVFQKKDLGENELCVLNDGVRQLLKTELGSFFTEYLQNQLLTKGMVILRDKIRFYEGQKLLDSLAETWSFFFCDVLSMLQAIFYPVQGKEPSVRQLALLHFRNIITLNIKLEDALSRPRARVPPAIIQMLLILQGVHESKGVTEDYLRLEGLIQKVVSPYLGSHGLYSNDGTSMQNSSCVLEKRLHRRWPKPGDHAKNPVVRSQSYNVPMLTPLVEYDVETSSVGSIGIRRHSVSEMTSCLEEGSVTDTTSTAMPSLAPASQPGLNALGKDLRFTGMGSGSTDMSGSVASVCLGSHLQPSSPTTSIFQDSHSLEPFVPGGGQSIVSPLDLCQPHVGSAPKSKPFCSSSPETITDQILDSIDSDHEGKSDQDGIFLEFSHRRCSDSS